MPRQRNKVVANKMQGIQDSSNQLQPHASKDCHELQPHFLDVYDLGKQESFFGLHILFHCVTYNRR